MAILRDSEWLLKYTPDHGSLVNGFYVPLLGCAVRYDRLTGYFNAAALALAARGVEELVLNEGQMRMIVGCTLGPGEVAAIERGETLRDAVEATLTAAPLTPLDGDMAQALELLAWLVAHRRLRVKVAVPCDSKRRPVVADGLFHEKAGIVEDKTGESLAFNGSLNETAAGWIKNWESLNVFTTWRDPDRVKEEVENFARLWADKAKHVITLDVPAAAQADLLRFMPDGDKPARLKHVHAESEPEDVPPEPAPEAAAPGFDLRRAVWSFINAAPSLPVGGDRVGEATSAVTPWPHQVRAFHRMYDHWPPKLLIADEVGLGKTIQAGMLLRQAWLAGKARRILILAPKAVCRQWQIELREKFNLNWPIYDGQKLSWYPSPAMVGHHEKPVLKTEWHQQDVVIASSHLMRRADRAKELLDAHPWDLVVLDEAHHARRRAAGSAQEGGPNALLRLMRGLRDRTSGLVLLTATPMQVHPVEVFDLLSLLGLPAEWEQSAFLRFFDDIGHSNPSHEAFDRMAAMFRAIERAYGPVKQDAVHRLGLTSGLRAKKLLGALRDPSNIPRRMLETGDRKVALRLMRLNTPINRLVSRHTRELLRAYFKAGTLTTRIAERRVEDRFIALSPDERALYDAVENYIASTYNQAVASGVSGQKRSALGFVMTIYRRRLASSFLALRETLEKRLKGLKQPGQGDFIAGLIEGEEDEDGDEPDEDEAQELAHQALVLEEQSEIERLIKAIRRLPADSKCARLRQELATLQAAGYAQVMVFTQYTDTMDFLRAQLAPSSGMRVMCFSGRGGEVANSDGSWRTISRDDVKRRFRSGEADLLLCTDAAAEGLNFQFCGALINYDMPWNPMRVEQRIGRIDRLGQQYPDIRIINLHYAETVETDVYVALRHRIGLFEKVVGGLQPILARMPGLITSRILTGQRGEDARRDAVRDIEAEVDRTQAESTLDIDAMMSADLTEPLRAAPALTMDDLDHVIGSDALMPAGTERSAMNKREYGYRQPGMATSVRVSTDPTYYEQNADSVELWSPGNPLFPMVEGSEPTPATTLSELLLLQRPAVAATG